MHKQLNDQHQHHIGGKNFSYRGNSFLNCEFNCESKPKCGLGGKSTEKELIIFDPVLFLYVMTKRRFEQ
jgi:hypothetical protein